MATLLFAHLFTEEQRTWLSSLGQTLGKEQELALVYCREAGSIRNAELRDLTGLDTLKASQMLRDLRDRGMLEPRGAGAQTSYVLPGQRGELEAQRGELQAQRGELQAQRGERVNPYPRDQLLAELPELLRARVLAVHKRLPTPDLRGLILELCEIKPRTPGELGALLEREVRKLVDRHLSPMLQAGALERTHPDIPRHPAQAYRAARRRA